MLDEAKEIVSNARSLYAAGNEEDAKQMLEAGLQVNGHDAGFVGLLLGAFDEPVLGEILTAEHAGTMEIPAPGGGTQTVSTDSAAAAAWAGNQGLGGANVRGSVMGSLPGLPAATPTGSESERARSVVALWAQSAPDDDVRGFCALLLVATDSPGGSSSCPLCGS